MFVVNLFQRTETVLCSETSVNMSHLQVKGNIIQHCESERIGKEAVGKNFKALFHMQPITVAERSKG
jgi:hypothetical protein